MKYVLLTLISVTITACSWFSKEECETVTTVGEVFLEAVSRPESFDQYVDQNRNKFDGSFYNCIDRKIAELKAISEKKKNECDETFDTFTDFWNDCYEEVEISYDNSATILGVIREVAKGSFRWDESKTGGDIILLKSLDPIFYNELIAIYKELPLDHLHCQDCDKKFCLFC